MRDDNYGTIPERVVWRLLLWPLLPLTKFCMHCVEFVRARRGGRPSRIALKLWWTQLVRRVGFNAEEIWTFVFGGATAVLIMLLGSGLIPEIVHHPGLLSSTVRNLLRTLW